MKHTIINMMEAVSVVLALLACTREILPENKLPEAPAQQLITFRVGAPGLLSRALSDASDDTLTRVQIAVYSPDSLLVSSGYADASGCLTLSLPAWAEGYKVCALANSAADLSAFTRYDEALSNLSRLQYSSDGLEMFCRRDNLSFNPETTVELSLQRFAAKVQLFRITNDIAYDPQFVIEKIYLVNVNTVCSYDFRVPEPDYAQSGAFRAAESAVTPLTSDNLDVTLTRGRSYSTTHTFYCYPNPAVDGSAGGRLTRLVVEAVFMGRRYYYPVNIARPGETLEHNTVYKITDLTITGPGGDSPDVPLDKESISFEIEVLDWNAGFDQSVTI